MTIDLSAAELLPGAARLAELHAAELPQKDELCGSFCTLLALRAAGLEIADQDTVALAAGAVLPPAGYDHLAALPEGEQGRSDYRIELPVIDGRRPGGHLGAGPGAGGERAQRRRPDGASRRRAVAAGHGCRNAADRRRRGTGERRPEPGHRRPLGLATAALGTAGTTWPRATIRWARRRTGRSGTSPAAWDAIRGAAGTLVVIADTYASLGWNGIHLQPIERVAASLRRDMLPSSGGALLIVPSARAGAVGAALGSAGLTVASLGQRQPGRRGELIA